MLSKPLILTSSTPNKKTKRSRSLPSRTVAGCDNTQKGTASLGRDGANNTQRGGQGGATMYGSFCGGHGGERDIQANTRRQLIVEFSETGI